MSELGYAKNMSPDDYNYYSGGMELDKDILTYAPKLWQSKQEKRNNRKSRYEKDATGLTSSEESAEEPPIVPKKNKKSGKKEYSAEQKAKLVARLKSAIEKRWEARMSAVEKRHVKELEAKAAPKPQPTAPKPQPTQPINIPAPRSVGRFKAAMW